MEGVVYSPLNAYSYGSYSPKPRQQNWRQRSSHHQQQQQQQQGGGGGRGGDYLDNYKRAQLKAILSQVNPGLTPRLRKGNTREVGIQVNPKVDASVQCSLGPRTLPRQRRRGLRRPKVLHSQRFAPDLEFLEQKYGYYHCKDCNIRWESAYIWCISGTNKVYFKQFCRKCDKGYNPYRVEPILCQTCSKTRCTCPQKKRHIDPRRPHRQELCGRCRGKRLSCDNTYSYKYIV
eukprot:gi/632948291/ref/XP_007889511.1/ PREDICTED: ZAR1-like protein [Callorhinchus milii]